MERFRLVLVKPVYLLVILISGAMAAGIWLWRPPLASSPEGKVAEGVDDLSGLLVSGGEGPVGETAVERQIRLLEGQVEYLEGQVRVLQEENEGLLERLGTLGMRSSGAGADALPQGDEPDFVGLGIELMKLRELQALPMPTVPVPAFELEEKILAWLRSFQPGTRGLQFGKALHALGVIPEAMDPLPGRAKLLRMQLGAWYDAGDRTLYVEEAGESEGLSTTREALGIAWANLLREYGETLYPKNRAGALTLDAQMAREALIAGDAGLTRFLHSIAQPPSAPSDELPAEDPDHPFNTVPLPVLLRDLHFFSFNEGFEFMQSLHSLGGFPQMGASYSRPPIMTAEVLDPQKYLAGPHLDPVTVEMPQLTVNGVQPYWDDVLGQFMCLRILLAWNDSELAGTGSQGWVADRLLVYAAEDQAKKDHAVWQTLWRDASSAEAFFTAMQKVLTQRDGEVVKPDEAGWVSYQVQGRKVWMGRNRQGNGVVFVDSADGEMGLALWKMFGKEDR